MQRAKSAILCLTPLLSGPLAGCQKTRACEASLSSEVETVVLITTEGPITDGRVVFDAGGGEAQTPTHTGEDHTFYLLGLPGAAQVDYTLESEEGICEGSISTSAISAALPTLEVTTWDEGATDGAGVFLGSVFELTGGRPYLVAFDRSGELVWHLPGDTNSLLGDLQLALEGEGILVNQFDGTFREDLAVLRRIGIDGVQRSEIRLAQGHHMFAQLPDGVIAYQSLDVRDWKDPETGEIFTLVGDEVMEIYPDGDRRRVTSTWDWLTPEHSLFWDLPSLYPQGIDWTHGNALKYDASSDTYLLSLGNAAVIATIDRDSRDVLATYGAVGATVSEDSAPLDHQHDPTWIADDRLLVFTSNFELAASGAVEYALEGGELVEAWQHGFEEGYFAPMLGQAERLEGGGTAINFGGAGAMQEVDASGEVVWEVVLESGWGFSQFVRLEDLYEVPR